VFRESFSKLSQQEMSRAEFLRLMGAAVLTFVGITTLLKNLGHITGAKPVEEPAARPYGAPRQR
jgi:hypothetical protein